MQDDFVVGYIRVSTGRQVRLGISPDTQRRMITAWAAERGHTIAPESIHEDAGKSGKRADNRPGLQAALDQVCRARGVLVVYSISRLARSIIDAGAIAQRLDRARADLVSLTEPIDTTTSMGRAIYGMFAVFAQLQRDMISEQTRDNLAEVKGRGLRCGQLAYGQTIDPAAQKRINDLKKDDVPRDERTAILAAEGLSPQLVPVATEKATIARIIARRREGASLGRIAAELEADQIPTKSGQSHWARSTLADLLRRLDPCPAPRGLSRLSAACKPAPASSSPPPKAGG